MDTLARHDIASGSELVDEKIGDLI